MVFEEFVERVPSALSRAFYDPNGRKIFDRSWLAHNALRAGKHARKNVEGFNRMIRAVLLILGLFIAGLWI